MRPRFSCVDTLLRCTAAAFVTLAAVRPVSVAAQQLVLNTPYQGRYRCGEEWKDATLIVTKMKGDQFEGTFALAGRLFQVGRAPARQMREAPKVKGTFSAGGGVVVRWEDKLMLRYDDSAERSVMFQGILSREGTLNGTLDYRGCDKLTAAVPGATAVVVATERAANDVLVARARAKQDSAWRQQADVELRPTLENWLANTTDRVILARFAERRLVDSVFGRGTPGMLETARARLSAKRDEVAVRIAARYRTSLDDVGPSLDGIAAGAAWANQYVEEVGDASHPALDELRAAYEKRRAAQWASASAQAVRGKLQSATSEAALLDTRAAYIGAMDALDHPTVRELLALMGRRAYYVRKARILGVTRVVPEAAQAARVTNSKKEPTEEDLYDAIVIPIMAADSVAMSTRRACDRLARGERVQMDPNSFAAAVTGVTCLGVLVADVGHEPLQTVTGFEKGACLPWDRHEGPGTWGCLVFVETRMGMPASVTRAAAAGDLTAALSVAAAKLVDGTRQRWYGVMRVRNGEWRWETVQ